MAQVTFRLEMGQPVIHSFLGLGGNVIGQGIFQEGVPMALVAWQKEDNTMEERWFPESVLANR